MGCSISKSLGMFAPIFPCCPHPNHMFRHLMCKQALGQSQEIHAFNGILDKLMLTLISRMRHFHMVTIISIGGFMLTSLFTFWLIVYIFLALRA